MMALLLKYSFYFVLNIYVISSESHSNEDDLYECFCLSDSQTNIDKSINKSVEYLEKQMSKHMIPGLAVGVSRYGKHIWNGALGWADLENSSPVHKDSIWRMASVSKALTSALVGRLLEDKRLDLNQSIYSYLKPNVFPVKQWKGKDVDMTLGQVMSHSAGLKVTDLLKDFQMIYDFKNVSQSLVQFVDEPLLSEPGTQYNYSNYGYQVVGAIIESVINDEYFNAINKMFEELKMNSTFCETSDMIIRHRVHDYLKSDYPILPDPTRNASEVHLMNALVIDDLLAMEAQWPAGGLVSSVEDLLTFGNFMLKGYKNVNNDTEYLKSSTVKQIWDPVIEKFRNKYGLSKEAHGWAVTELDRPIVCQNKCQMPSTISRFIWKTGGLTGVTNILMILPDQDIIVALLTNTSDVQDDIVEAALMVAKEFMN